MRICKSLLFMFLFLISCTHYPSGPRSRYAPAPTAIDCMDTCDAQRELCIQFSTRMSESKNVSDCVSDWTSCSNLCLTMIK